MTVIDPAFEGVGKEPGILIWRIEAMEVKPVPLQEYGNFYVGDSYIVLYTTVSKSGRYDWNIHFWLGKETSQDEAGAAAIKTVELDDLLGGRPVQHREVQGFESSLFLSLFKKGIRYLEGGVKSGFHHVENVAVKRLWRVKGRRNVRLYEVPINVSSMTHDDCYILDSGDTIFVWQGAQSGRMERIKAIQAANAIRDDVHCGRGTVSIVDGSSSSGDIGEYFDALGGGSFSEVAATDGSSDDSAFETSFETKVALYKVWEDDNSDLQVEQISEKPLKQEYLKSDDCFLLDGGLNGLFVWIGKGSSKKERLGAMQLADKYMEKNSYPKWLPVKRVVDGGEPPAFKWYFETWEDGASGDGSSLDPRLFKLSNKSGKLTTEEVCNFTQEDLSEDDVMVLDQGKTVFIWIGQGADDEEKSGSLRMTQGYINADPTSRGADDTEIETIAQGSEPEAFKSAFKEWNPDLWSDLSNLLAH